MIQTYPVPASPAPAEGRYGSPPEAAKQKKINKKETDIFSSELNCFKNCYHKYTKKVQSRYLD
jgi:hypothetical protein